MLKQQVSSSRQQHDQTKRFSYRNKNSFNDIEHWRVSSNTAVTQHEMTTQDEYCRLAETKKQKKKEKRLISRLHDSRLAHFHSLA